MRTSVSTVKLVDRCEKDDDVEMTLNPEVIMVYV
jgi:hypothetical protein